MLSQYGNTLVNLKKIFLCKEKEEMLNFLQKVYKANGFRDINDYYEIESNELGKEQFGKVKLGRNLITKEKVAIKVVQKSKMNQKEAQLIRTEIDTINFLKYTNHTNIVTTFDVFEDNSCIYLIMEYMPDGTLQKFINDSYKLLCDSQIKSIAKQIASGLQFLNKFGILHRDIKPENILLKKSGSNIIVKISDFGLSKVISLNGKTDEGYGTLVFSSPEILTRRKYDKKVDVWSFGVILFYLTYSFLPFDGKDLSNEQIAKKIVFETLLLPKISLRNINFSQISLIKNCLTKSPAERYDIEKVLNCKWFS